MPCAVHRMRTCRDRIENMIGERAAQCPLKALQTGD
jgi:hypothetical protein